MATEHSAQRICPESASARHVPPLRFAWLTPAFDAVSRATLREERWRPQLIEQARIEPGHRVLDLGCGTAALALRIQRAVPGARVVGLDADAGALAIARAKLRRAGLEVELHCGLADAADFAPASFDRVVSSLFFHHLVPEVKRRTLARVRDWLRPGGELHVADWGRPGSLWTRAAFLGVQLLDGLENTRDHARTGLAPFLVDAGFASVRETRRVPTAFGTLSLYRAVRPWDGPAAVGKVRPE